MKTRLSELEAEAEGLNRQEKQGNLHCDWFILSLVLLTPTTWFSLDHKPNVRDRVVSGIGTMFSLDQKLYASDYDSDSDSVASENQPEFIEDSL